MVKKISILMATLLCASLSAMENKEEHVISENPFDYLEPHRGRAQKIFSQMDLSQFPVIAEVGVMTGSIVKYLAQLAPKSEIIGIVRPESPFNLAKDKSGPVCFLEQDISKGITLPKQAHLLIFLGQLPYVNDKKAFIADLANNIAPGGTLITACPADSSLIKPFAEVKEDPTWKLDKIDINKIWMPAKREEIETHLQEAKLTIKSVQFDDSPVIFKNKEVFKLFLSAVTSGIKARTGNSETLKDPELLKSYLETLAQKYLILHPEKENGNVHYYIPEHVFIAQKKN